MKIAALTLALVCIGFASGARVSSKAKMMSTIKAKLASKVRISLFNSLNIFFAIILINIFFSH